MPATFSILPRAVFFILRNYVKNLDFFTYLRAGEFEIRKKSENFTYFNSPKFEKCQKPEQKSKENCLTHRKQSKIFACGALRGQKQLKYKYLPLFKNCRPKGGDFFNVFEKPNKTHWAVE